jgi:hypothetical protein
MIAGGFVLYPGLFFEHPHRGLSFYGNYFPTVIPFAAGLATSVACMSFAAYFMPKAPGRIARLRYLLLAIAACLAGLLLTPEQASPFFYWAHALATIFLFVVAGGTALWILTHEGANRLDRMLLWVLIAGTALSLLSTVYVGVLGLLSFGQVLAMNAATLIIVRGSMRWLSEHEQAGQEVRE